MIEAWPVPPPKVERIGQGVCADCRTRKDGHPRPHNGADIFVPAGTPVVAPVQGTIIRVVDGRNDPDEGKRAAGLWIDMEEPARKAGENRRIHRFLHLGSASVKDGQKVSVGQTLGEVAPAGTSGLGDSPPHLHYEIRRTSGVAAYGDPIDPRYDLADAVAANAWKFIPTIVHVVGVERYEDPRYIRVAQAVRKVWDEQDPDRRLILAHEADEAAKREGQVSYWEAVKDSAGKKVDEKIVSPGKHALKEAGKEIVKGAGHWWDELSWGWKAGIIGGGVLVAGVTVKSLVR